MLKVVETDFRRIKDDWISQEAELAQWPFQCYEWVALWAKYFVSKDEDLIMIAAYDGGKLVAIAPLVKKTMRIKNKITICKYLAFIGAREFSYNGFIVNPKYMLVVFEELLNYLHKNYSNYLLYLCDIPEEYLEGYLAFKKYSIKVIEDMICPIVEIPEKWEEFWGSLGASTKRGLKRHVNALNASGKWIVEKLNVYDEGRVKRLFDMHYKRWNLSNTNSYLQKLECFEKEVIKYLGYNGCLRHYSILLNGKCIASSFMYDYKGVRYFHKGGYDLSYQKLSPGMVLHLESVRDAIECKMKKYNFLRGNEEYKKRFTKKSNRNYRLILSNNVVKNALFKILMG